MRTEQCSSIISVCLAELLSLDIAKLDGVTILYSVPNYCDITNTYYCMSHLHNVKCEISRVMFL